ncbi:Zn-ribbon domain-containing OB-fold protein [Streptomyces sp. NEAU-174]|uniref:Zn-ribbon domain-containing OB-fold protein n=1 Tax=Streptomyces sp. NEAU-174 TaxID=3458254 RepID=UPI004043BC97
MRAHGTSVLPASRQVALQRRPGVLEESERPGHAASYVVVHRASPGFEGEAPYVVAIAALPEGPRLLTNLPGAPPEPAGLTIGAPLNPPSWRSSTRGSRSPTRTASRRCCRPPMSPSCSAYARVGWTAPTSVAAPTCSTSGMRWRRSRPARRASSSSPTASRAGHVLAHRTSRTRRAPAGSSRCPTGPSARMRASRCRRWHTWTRTGWHRRIWRRCRWPSRAGRAATHGHSGRSC